MKSPENKRLPEDKRLPENKRLRDLQRIPGVGKSLSRDLLDIGFTATSQLAGQNAEALYERLCSLRGERIDRCVLYVFRCAVYFATLEAADQTHDPELLRWWRWKDTPKNPEEL